MKPSGPSIVSPERKTLARAPLPWVLGLAAAAPVMALAQVALHPFADMSLEELMNETVTSVSKREQRLFDSASAVYVISGEDIRRSGVVHIADAFRSVPGMNVASVNSYQWAVSVRGFNEVYNSKLLVLIDGRPVYNPLFSGVAWAVQQPFLEDLDRIEVIRGPGATIWGSNAVNGVINIVSLDARDTQGGLVFGGGVVGGHGGVGRGSVRGGGVGGSGAGGSVGGGGVSSGGVFRSRLAASGDGESGDGGAGDEHLAKNFVHVDPWSPVRSGLTRGRVPRAGVDNAPIRPTCKQRLHAPVITFLDPVMAP